MTIVRNIPQQLILAHAPWLMGGFLIACIVAGCAAGLALLFAGQTSGLLTILAGLAIPGLLFGLLIKRDQVIFDAHAGHVTLQRQSLFRYHRQTLPLDSVQDATLDQMGEQSRPVLRIATRGLLREVPLLEAHNTGTAPEQTVRVINSWLSLARRAN